MGFTRIDTRLDIFFLDGLVENAGTDCGLRIKIVDRFCGKKLRIKIANKFCG